jgi:hypothetical protein
LRFHQLIERAEKALKKCSKLWALAKDDDDIATSSELEACLAEIRKDLCMFWSEHMYPRTGIKSSLFLVEAQSVSAHAKCQVGMYKGGVCLWELNKVTWIKIGLRVSRLVRETRILIEGEGSLVEFGRCCLFVGARLWAGYDAACGSFFYLPLSLLLCNTQTTSVRRRWWICWV